MAASDIVQILDDGIVQLLLAAPHNLALAPHVPQRRRCRRAGARVILCAVETGQARAYVRASVHVSHVSETDVVADADANFSVELSVNSIMLFDQAVRVVTGSVVSVLIELRRSRHSRECIRAIKQRGEAVQLCWLPSVVVDELASRERRVISRFFARYFEHMKTLPMLARPSMRSAEEARRRSVVLRVAVVLDRSRSRSAQILDRDLLPLADAGVAQLEGVGCDDDVVQIARPIVVRGDVARTSLTASAATARRLRLPARRLVLAALIRTAWASMQTWFQSTQDGLLKLTAPASAKNGDESTTGSL